MSPVKPRPPPRILIVESDGMLARTIPGLLICEVEIAASYEAAEEVLGRRLFDLVVSDTLLGDGRGRFDGVARLRQRAVPTAIGVISVHGVTPGDIAFRGFAFFLAKPFEGDVLLAAILGALGNRLADDAPEAMLAHRYFAALAARDWTSLADLCADDVVYHLPRGGPLGGVVVGRDAFRSYTAEVFEQFPAASFPAIMAYNIRRNVIVRYQTRWTTTCGTPFEQAGAVVFRIVGGQITRIGVDLDADQLERLTLALSPSLS